MSGVRRRVLIAVFSGWARVVDCASDLTDFFHDGTPEFLRLDSEGDRRAFRRWVTFLGESQYYRQVKKLPREISDCAALLRFAYREALREHDGAWASGLELESAPGE